MLTAADAKCLVEEARDKKMWGKMIQISNDIRESAEKGNDYIAYGDMPKDEADTLEKLLRSYGYGVQRQILNTKTNDYEKCFIVTWRY